MKHPRLLLIQVLVLALLMVQPINSAVLAAARTADSADSDCPVSWTYSSVYSTCLHAVPSDGPSRLDPCKQLHLDSVSATLDHHVWCTLRSNLSPPAMGGGGLPGK